MVTSVMFETLKRHLIGRDKHTYIYLLVTFNFCYMLLTIGFILIVLWLLGVVAFPVIGSFIHILLVVAIIVVLVRIIRGV